MTARVMERSGFILVAAATLCAIVGLAVALFLNPVWIGFEQDRSDVSALTGYTPAQVRAVTGSILSDMVFGPPDFDVTVDGVAVLSERDRSHLADVRGAFGALGLVALASFACLVAFGLAARGGRQFWRAVRAGALLLLGGVLVAGSVAALFFEQAFELLHRLLFPAGTYTFDPGTDRMVQLFPELFWFETGVALGVTLVVLAVGVALAAGRLGKTSPASSAAGSAA